MDIKTFSFGGNAIRVAENEGAHLFIAKDVCDFLELTNVSQTISYLDEDEKGIISNDTPGGYQNMLGINESGLYSLILRSRKPEAKAFKKWITSEVIPSIRKHGAYLTNKKVEEVLLSPDTIIQLAQTIKEERAAKEGAQLLLAQAEQQVAIYKPKALFADAVTAAKTCILVGDLAKILKQNGIDTGEKRFYKWLRENGYMIYRNGMNVPSQRAMNLGLFEIKETPIVHNDGSTTLNITPKVTGKGQSYFYNKLKPAA